MKNKKNDAIKVDQDTMQAIMNSVFTQIEILENQKCVDAKYELKLLKLFKKRIEKWNQQK